MALPNWTVANNYSLGTLNERVYVEISLPLEDTNGVTTSLISGTLPGGLRIVNNKIIGSPLNVSKATTYKFVIRAKTDDGIKDRTFVTVIEGADAPVWTTPAGSLGIGPNNVYFILDSSPIDFQLLAADEDLTTGQTLEYYIGDGDGELPPGITLSKTGKITGVVDPLRALDINQIKLGYDAGNFGMNVYDWGVDSGDNVNSLYYGEVEFNNIDLSRPPRKLNRRYAFTVTVADDTSFTKRTFEIYVVSDEFARADNTIMAAGTGVFTADFTYLRNPIWITPNDLGVRRANNYQTIFLDTLKQPGVSGSIKYIAKTTNPGTYKLKTTGEIITNGFYDLSGVLPNFPKSNRGPESLNESFLPDPIQPSEWEVIESESQSVFPTGLSLDPDIGELAGIIPYQPTITRDYKFTVGAFRYDEDTGLVTVFGTYLYDQLAGSDTLTIGKLPLGLQDGIDDLNDLVGQELEIEGRNYKVISVDGSNTEFDTVTFDKNISSIYSITPLTVAEPVNSGLDYFFVNTLPDGDKLSYSGKELRYSSLEIYTIKDVHPYNKYEVTAGTPGQYVELKTDITDFEVSFDQSIRRYLNEITNRIAYVTSVSDGIGVTKVTIYVAGTANTNNRSFMSNIFHTDDSSTIKVASLATFDRLLLDKNLARAYNAGFVISWAAFRGGFFSQTFSVLETDLAESLRTFNLQIIGEVESVITWKTDSDLGTIKSNRNSVFKVVANTTLTSGNVKYTLVSGNLPFGMALKENGEIVGKTPSVGTVAAPGITKFDNNATTFDGIGTSFDRVFEFTVLAKDRYVYSSVTRKFKITIDSSDTLSYSNLYMKPFLPSNQRTLLSSFTNNASIFDSKNLYRPSDPEFGIQKELKSLVFAGIETKNIEDYVAATAQNHRRKSYNFGTVKTAQAKLPGTTDVVYEVVYVELIDPANPTANKTRTNFLSTNRGKDITVDSIEIESIDDAYGGGVSGTFLDIIRKNNTTYRLNILSNSIGVQKRNGFVVLLSTLLSVPIVNEFGTLFNIQFTQESANDGLEETWRFRPDNTTLKTDNSSVTVSDGQNRRHYISNIDNMRDNINEVGEKSKEFLPLWMQTAQLPSLKELGYVFAIPLVYVKPGYGETTKNNINNYIKTSTFDFKKINYDIDRYIVDATTENNQEQYILFANYIYNA